LSRICDLAGAFNASYPISVYDSLNPVSISLRQINVAEKAFKTCLHHSQNKQCVLAISRVMTTI